MNFDSHIGATVLLTADLVNLLTPGESGGRRYMPPVDAVAGLEEVFSRTPWASQSRTPTPAEAAGLAEAAGRLRAVFEAIDRGDVDRAAVVLNELMELWSARPTLARHDGEPWHLHFHGLGVGYVLEWAAGMATGLAFVVGSEYYDRLGICSADGCDRVYADTSKNGTRRFCSTGCQNRVKAAAFRARRRQLG